MGTTLAIALLVLALLAAVPFLLTAWVTWRHRIPCLPDERHTAVAADGWRLALYRYRPRTDGPGRGPVILCHGLLANRANLDLDERRSLARHLAGQGFDAWVLELRGSGLSRDPSGRRGLARVRFDDYAEQDVPAAIGAVCKETGWRSVQWVGHSMGGMVLYAYLSHTPDPRVASAVTIGSPVDFTVLARTARRTLRLRPLLRFGRVPVGLGIRAFVPLLRYVPAEVRRMGILPANLERRDLGDILVNVIEGFGSTRVLHQFGDWVERGTFASLDGARAYGELTHLRCPLLVIAADDDLVAPPESVSPAFDRAPAPEKAYRLFGAASGDDREYGHGDILLSDAARRNVFPVITDWLVKHAPSVEAAPETASDG
jgi:pimeloyl-ACP methyl ester carboxylesterase